MSRTYRWKLALGAVLLGGVAVFSTQGCTVTTSNDPFDGGGGGRRDSGGGGDNSTACDRCLAPKCASQWASCQRNTDCLKIYYCAINCSTGSSSCVDNCFNSYPNGNADYFALASCNVYYGCNGGTCTSQCSTQLACVPNFDAGPGPQTCQQCTDQKCATEKNRCAAGSECEKYGLCTATCTDPDINKALQCVDDCGAARPGGKADSDALANCTKNSCGNECK
ncbi:hypothetical protein [Pendulispora albinea]|uniref:Uncharacterized protein n=1 Tax=Pendulispora albinea TaxID=2741071 RepID=A0ABZ2MCF8_9BACT